MLQFIPDGKRNASKITLGPYISIMIWKEEVQDKCFGLKWSPLIHGDEIFQNILHSPFRSINEKSCYPSSTIKYECRRQNISNVQDYIKILQASDGKILSKMNLKVTIDKFEDLYKLNFSDKCIVNINFKIQDPCKKMILSAV